MFPPPITTEIWMPVFVDLLDLGRQDFEDVGVDPVARLSGESFAGELQ